MGLPFFEKKKKSAAPAKKDGQQESGLVLRDDVKDTADAKDKDEKKEGASLQRARVQRKFPVAEYEVILRPVMSAKAFTEGKEQYIFEVAKTAGKVEIKKAFYNIFGVMPQSVRTQRYKSRDIHFGRIRGTSKEWKKAIITLKKGETVHVA